MRIASLLPAATEMVAALGAGDELVAISHECDWPAEVTGLPRVTSSPIDPSIGSGAIDRAVAEMLARGELVIGVDSSALRHADPDVVITQSLCEVCAVDGREVRPLVDGLDRPARIVKLGGHDLAGVYDDILAVGRSLGRSEEATELVRRMRDRLAAVCDTPFGRAGLRPRVVCVEWLDPLYLAGHWVPELVDAAGGIDVGARPGERSRRLAWSEIEALEPDVVLVALCGFGVERSRKELASLSDPDARRVLAGCPVAVIDGNAYTSRSGPRLAEAAEVIRDAIHVASETRRRAPDATNSPGPLSNSVS